jgi:hypothetical protein
MNQFSAIEGFKTDKKELAERVKELEERYADIEGAKAFSRCFVTAMRSIEEFIEGSEEWCVSSRLICQLHNNLRSFLENIARTIKVLKGEISKSSKEIVLLKAVHEVDRREWEDQLRQEQAKYQSKAAVQNFNALKEKYNQMRIDVEKKEKELNNRIYLMTVNIKILQDKLKKVEEDTNVIHLTQTIQQLTTDLQQAKHMLKSETEDKSNMGFKLHTMLDAAKYELNEKSNSLLTTIDQYNTLLNAYKKAIVELEEGREKMKRTEERMSMTVEDTSHMQFKIDKLETIIQEKDKEIDEMRRSKQDLEIQLKLQREGLVQKDEVSMKGILFDFVWDSAPAQQNNISKHKAIDNKKNDLDIELNKNTTINPQNIKDIKLERVDMKKYSYQKPKYRALINDLLPGNESASLKYNPAFPVWLHIVIRAIFDSKFTEVLLSYNKGKRISRFVDFVYCWLGNFFIDKTTREVKMLEYTEKEAVAQRNRVDLLVGLEVVSNSKLWEVSLFRDFLEEELGLDELVYFLHCRFILFKGSQLSIPTASFCITHFMGKDRVFDAIDRIMHAYPEDERRELKRKLTEYAKNSYKDPEVFDCGMVLAILLEFYRKEKKENFIRFEELYNITEQSLKIPRVAFPFSEFYKLISETYDKNATDLDICNVYREAYIAGGANITCDSVLLTFSETPFWINHLRLKGQNAEPKYDSIGDIDTTEPRGKECKAVYKYVFDVMVVIGSRMRSSLCNLRSI